MRTLRIKGWKWLIEKVENILFQKWEIKIFVIKYYGHGFVLITEKNVGNDETFSSHFSKIFKMELSLSVSNISSYEYFEIVIKFPTNFPFKKLLHLFLDFSVGFLHGAFFF